MPRRRGRRPCTSSSSAGARVRTRCSMRAAEPGVARGLLGLVDAAARRMAAPGLTVHTDHDLAGGALAPKSWSRDCGGVARLDPSPVPTDRRANSTEDVVFSATLVRTGEEAAGGPPRGVRFAGPDRNFRQ